jgi:hypothetical protein
VTRLSFDRAVEFIELTMDCSIDLQSSGLIEAYILDRSVDEVQLALEAFTHGLGQSLDPDSVEITADHLEDSDIPVVRIVIRTEVH